jgi:O-methyltransferase
MQHVDDIDKISILRLDGDMYSSTIEVLEALYDKVQPGGFIIVDDWTLPGANKAVKDYLQRKNSSPNFIQIDRNSAYWKK